MTRAPADVATRLGGGGAIDVPVGRVIVACLLCMAIAALAILLIRQRMGGGHALDALRRLTPRVGAIEVVEVKRLTLHADVGLIRHDGREYLLLIQSGTHRVLRNEAASPARDAAS